MDIFVKFTSTVNMQNIANPAQLSRYRRQTIFLSPPHILSNHSFTHKDMALHPRAHPRLFPKTHIT